MNLIHALFGLYLLKRVGILSFIVCKAVYPPSSIETEKVIDKTDRADASLQRPRNWLKVFE